MPALGQKTVSLELSKSGLPSRKRTSDLRVNEYTP